MIGAALIVTGIRLLGLAFLTFVAVRTALGLFRATKRRRARAGQMGRAHEAHRLRVLGEGLLIREEHAQAELSWSGFREFRVERIVRSENLSESIASFYLAPLDGKTLPAFFPGQFLTFRLEVPGAEKDVVRCYSLSDAHDPERYRVSIKRLPGGVASNHFHDRVNEGDVLMLRQPAGKFCVDLSDPEPVVLIAGGVGVTPLLSMLNGITAAQPGREVWFLFSNRSGEEVIQGAHLEELCAGSSAVRLVFLYSTPTEEDLARIAADSMHLAGRVDRALLGELLPPECLGTHQFYICGPGLMMEAVEKDLLDLGAPSEHIHTEAFGAPSVSATQREIPGIDGDCSHEVSFERSGKTLTWGAASGSLLELGESGGLDLEFGCGAGDCGTCQVTLSSGEVAYLREPPENPEPGTCLVCIAVPLTDLSIDA